MPAADSSDSYPRIPLTRFHMNAAEFLELSAQTPVVLTGNGDDRYVIADVAYFRQLEALAAGHLQDAMDIQSVRAAEMTDQDRAAIIAARPSAAEIASDRWDT